METLLKNESIKGILAFGVMMCILSKGIDLTPGAVVALVSVVCASLAQKSDASSRLLGAGNPLPTFVIVVIGLAIGVLIGFLIGATIAYTKIPPFIATLGSQLICRAIAKMYSNKPVSSLTESFRFLGDGKVGVIPMIVIVFVIMFLISYFILNKTRFGKNVYAIGGNDNAARVSGINVEKNLIMMVDEKACAGNIIDNPVRKDIEEAAAICGVDFIVNVVLNEHKKIIKAVAGDVTKAHREGCAFLDTLYQKKIKERADIVIVSQGGAPKDLNLYQTQKALDNAKHAVKDGGIIILVGSCKEGLGEKTFEQWITEAKEPRDLIKRVKEDFKLGGHKAAAIAMMTSTERLLSRLPD